MFNLKNLFTRALLALMLVGGAGAASAGPVYRVTIDSSSVAGSGVFDFSFLGFDTAADATAVLSNFAAAMATARPRATSAAAWKPASSSATASSRASCRPSILAGCSVST